MRTADVPAMWFTLGVSKGWVVLFPSAAALAREAWVPWGSSLAVSIVVCIAAFLFSWLGSTASLLDNG